MYLLDTNTLIYYFKGKGKVAVRLLQVAPREVAVFHHHGLCGRLVCVIARIREADVNE